MPLDGLTLHILTDELKSQIVDNKIEKVYQPSKDEFIFHLRNREGAKKLYISVSSSAPRINLTDMVPENPPTPPMLCMFMRKHFTGCVISNIEQLNLDRILIITLNGKNEIGDAVEFKLVFELMPKTSNMIILNSEGIIIEATRKSDYSEKTGRQIQPGFRYLFPEIQNKLSIIDTDEETIADAIINNLNKRLSSSILDTVQGASPLVAREMAYNISENDSPVYDLNPEDKERLVEAIHKLKNLITSEGKPVMLVKDNSFFDISFIEINQYGTAITNTYENDFSTLIEKYYSEKYKSEKSNQQSKELSKILTNLIVRATRKSETRKQELEACKDKDKYRIYAELILSNQYSLKKGSLYYDLENYYDNYNPIRIKADPALSPGANSQKYFKEYNKLKNAEKLLSGLIEESEAEISFLDSELDLLNRAESYSDVAEIKNELADEGFIKKKAKAKNKSKPLPPLKYISDDGYIILVGRNNIQNEQISFKTAAKDDSWFHTQSFPGSHVIVIGNGDILPERTCRQAAVIAAYNSSAGSSGRVAVDYTEARELKRPKNGKKGMVIYHTYNTMWVTPDKELVERLKCKK